MPESPPGTNPPKCNMKHTRNRQQSHARSSQLRIVGGTWRSRKFPVADVEGLRPTPDRVREMLFNWLTGRISGARCLDAFSGTGALGLEALSRGASEVVFLEYSLEAAQTLKSTLKTLCSDARVEQTDALQWLSRPARHTFDLVFLDPPFHKQLLQPACEHLQANGWLAQDALVYVEAENRLGPLLPVPANWERFKEKITGQVISCLYRVGQDFRPEYFTTGTRPGYFTNKKDTNKKDQGTSD